MVRSLGGREKYVLGTGLDGYVGGLGSGFLGLVFRGLG